MEDAAKTRREKTDNQVGGQITNVENAASSELIGSAQKTVFPGNTNPAEFLALGAEVTDSERFITQRPERKSAPPPRVPPRTRGEGSLTPAKRPIPSLNPEPRGDRQVPPSAEFDAAGASKPVKPEPSERPVSRAPTDESVRPVPPSTGREIVSPPLPPVRKRRDGTETGADEEGSLTSDDGSKEGV